MSTGTIKRPYEIAGFDPPIIYNPRRQPGEIDLQYAVAAALVGHAIRARGSDEAQAVYGNILRFAARFPEREMGVMMVSDMNRAIGDELFSVPEFSDWADSIADLMIFGH